VPFRPCWPKCSMATSSRRSTIELFLDILVRRYELQGLVRAFYDRCCPGAMQMPHGPASSLGYFSLKTSPARDKPWRVDLPLSRHLARSSVSQSGHRDRKDASTPLKRCRVNKVRCGSGGSVIANCESVERKVGTTSQNLTMIVARFRPGGRRSIEEGARVSI
jgi:hypothetical protein